jgi:hypothetical protein
LEVELGDPEALNKAQSYLDACSPEVVHCKGTKFEALVLACASDDQKSVRRKMELLVRRIFELIDFELNSWLIDSFFKIKLNLDQS